MLGIIGHKFSLNSESFATHLLLGCILEQNLIIKVANNQPSTLNIFSHLLKNSLFSDAVVTEIIYKTIIKV